jgi:hypothetical protein
MTPRGKWNLNHWNVSSNIPIPLEIHGRFRASMDAHEILQHAEAHYYVYSSNGAGSATRNGGTWEAVPSIG